MKYIVKKKKRRYGGKLVMNHNQLLYIAKLRISVAFLGEAHQKAWWSCSLFSSSSTAFLSPIFGKTVLMSRYYGAKEAAAIVHDEHIGIGKGVYHLFRLPEEMERELHEILQDKEILQEVNNLITSPGMAIQFLESSSVKIKQNLIGPVRIAITSDIDKLEVWKSIAGIYYYAFNNGIKIFPYFSEGK